MTSTLASNAILSTNVMHKYSLAATKEGAPLNRQVPRTLQVYNGVAGTTIDYDGSDDVLILTSAFTGNLTIRFGPAAQQIRNNLGREIKIHIPEATTRTITLDTSPAFMRLNGTNLTQLSHVIPGDLIAKTITISPTNSTLWNLDYGSAVASLLPIPLSPTSVIVPIKYQAVATTPISGLARFGVPPYTSTAVTVSTDTRFGRLVVSGSNLVYYPPTRNFSPSFSIPVTINDAAGSSVISTILVGNDTLSSSIFSNNSHAIPRVTYVGTISGQNGVYSKPNGVPIQLLFSHSADIVCLAVNQNDSLLFIVDVTNTVYYYDRVLNVGNAIPITFFPTLASAGVGTISCISYNHDTNQLFIFGETVAHPIAVVTFKPYQRSTVTPLLERQNMCFLEDALDPAQQEGLAAIFDAASYVTGCEFIDGTDFMVLSVYVGSDTRSKLITLNSRMFGNRGLTVGTTTFDQYIVGVYDNALLDNDHVTLFSNKAGNVYYLCMLNGTTGSYNAIADYSFNNNTMTNADGISVSGIAGLPTEARATRNLLNY